MHQRERKIEPHVRRTSGERDESAVNVWCHFAVRGNSRVSNIGTHISAGKHLFNSHPPPLAHHLPKSCPNDSNPPAPSPFLSFSCLAFIRHFARTCLWKRDDWRNSIRLKAVHRAHTDVVPINGLKAILFPTCACTRPFRSWPVATKMKVAMYATTSHITL